MTANSGQASTDTEVVGVVEVGSGSVKLLVTDGGGCAGRTSDRLSRSIKTRLLSGDAATLDPDGLAATAKAFEEFGSDLTDLAPDAVSVVATAVARSAADIEPLQELCRQAFGVSMQRLTGSEEARLGLLGATAGRELSGPSVVIDIGSGSTEVSAGEIASPTTTDDGFRGCSLPIGARTLTEQYLVSDPPGPDELSSALSIAELHYDDLRRDMPDLGQTLAAGTLFGIGALAEIARVEIGVTDPDESVDGYHLTKAGAEEIFRVLATEAVADRRYNPGLSPDHVDDIVGGLCILVEFLRRFDLPELVVSERGLAHGQAIQLLGRATTND